MKNLFYAIYIKIKAHFMLKYLLRNNNSIEYLLPVYLHGKMV